MATSTKTELRSAVFNLPNQLTVMRLVLAVVLFGLMSCGMIAVGRAEFGIAA